MLDLTNRKDSTLPQIKKKMLGESSVQVSVNSAYTILSWEQAGTVWQKLPHNVIYVTLHAHPVARVRRN